MAVALLATAGFEVVASTGKPGEAGYLGDLGATTIMDRAELSAPGRPLAKERWAGAVDAVGSHTLANALAGTRYGGTVAACGLAQGIDLPGSVAPFILRGVTLAGVDSVMAPQPARRDAWARLARDLDPAALDALTGHPSPGGRPHPRQGHPRRRPPGPRRAHRPVEPAPGSPRLRGIRGWWWRGAQSVGEAEATAPHADLAVLLDHLVGLARLQLLALGGRLASGQDVLDEALALLVGRLWAPRGLRVPRPESDHRVAWLAPFMRGAYPWQSKISRRRTSMPSSSTSVWVNLVGRTAVVGGGWAGPNAVARTSWATATRLRRKRSSAKARAA